MANPNVFGFAPVHGFYGRSVSRFGSTDGRTKQGKRVSLQTTSFVRSVFYELVQPDSSFSQSLQKISGDRGFVKMSAVFSAEGT